MVALPDTAREVLDGPHLAHVVTMNADGSPQVSCVWVGLDGDEVVFGSLGAWRKLRNLERDPRVVLSVEAPGANAIGMQEYLVLQGTATVQLGGAPELLQELAHVYIGPDVKFPPMDDPPPGASCASRSTSSRASARGTTERRLGGAGDLEDAVDEVGHALVELVPPDQLPTEHLGAARRRPRRTSSAAPCPHRWRR